MDVDAHARGKAQELRIHIESAAGHATEAQHRGTEVGGGSALCDLGPEGIRDHKAFDRPLFQSQEGKQTLRSL